MANTKSLDLELGSSQYASITDGSQTGLDITTDFTIEFWADFETITGSTIINKYESGVGGYLVELSSGSNLKILYSADGTNKSESYTTAAISGTGWHHYAIVVDISAPADTIIYIDGVSQTVTDNLTAATSLVGTSEPFQIGANQTPAEYLDAKLEHVRVWNDIRTATEIAQYMFQEPAVDEAGLVSWWKFDDNYLDETSNDNDLTASGSPVFSTDVQWTFDGTKEEIEHCVDDDTVALWHMNGAAASAAKTDNAEGTAALDLTEVNTPTAATGFDGEANGAYELNGSTQYLEITNDADIYGTTGSISAWIYLDIGSTNYGIYTDTSATLNAIHVQFLVNTDDNLVFHKYDNSDNQSVIGNISLNTEQWYYVNAVWEDGEGLKVYVNGVLDNTGDITTGASGHTASDNINIGRRYNGLYLNGKLDEVSLSTRAKSAEEIAKYYSGTVSAKYYSGAGDGFVVNTNVTSWAASRSDATGDTAYPVAASDVSAIFNQLSNNQIHRAFYPFVTSTLPDDAEITLGQVAIKSSATAGANADTVDADLVSNSQASTTTLTTADYDQLGTTVYDSIAFADWAVGYNIFTLDETGLAEIDATGNSQFGIKCSRDTDNSVPTGQNYIASYFSESTGNEPYLWVEYIADSGVSFSVSSTMSISESALQNTNYSVSDTISMSENISVLKGLAFAVSDTISIAGSFLGSLTAKVNSTLNITDNLKRFTLLWTDRTKPTTSYSDRSKPSTSYSDRSKPTTNWTNRT